MPGLFSMIPWSYSGCDMASKEVSILPDIVQSI